jgi:hypothetical protein
MGPLDRRDFLSTSLSAVAAFNVLPSLAVPTDTPPARPPSLCRAAQFRAALGTRFRIEGDGVSESVRLTDVHEGPQSPGLEQFTTVFVSERGQSVAPGFYRVSHPDLGKFELRLDPGGRDAHTAAVFNLLVREA